MSLQFDERGLIPAIAQDRLTGQIRMVAFMNAEALAKTLASGRATFFSRSRQALWEKGETSGNALVVRTIHADCDADVLLLGVDPEGPSCHTGRPTCFFRALSADGVLTDSPREAHAFLFELEQEILSRKTTPTEKSYTTSLLDGGAGAIGAKLREEAGELAEAIASEADDRVAAEAADLVYHLLVALRLRDVDVRRVMEVLSARAGTSGLAEKASRKKPV